MVFMSIITQVRSQMRRFVLVLLACSLSLRWVFFESCVNLWLAAIFLKSKMAAVSHIQYVLILKNHQICIERTTQTHSEGFGAL